MTSQVLHAASRDALAAAELRLLDVIDQSADRAAQVDPRKVGEELFSVLVLLNKESGLRRLLADSSSAPAGRERLLRQLLAGKVSEQTLDVLTTAVTARWSTPRELLDGIESLAVTALLVLADREGRLDTIEDELFRFSRIVAGQPELERLLSDNTAEPAGKTALADTLLASKVDPITRILVDHLVALPRGRHLVDGLEELAAAAAKRRERSVAYVRSATMLSVAQQDRLTSALSRIYGRPIALHLEVVPELLGGLVIKVGAEVIDGSAVGQLAQLQRRLAG